ncbi:hypothetical protein [Thioalkalivibrio halophilus]|uniref:HEPN domain-containing protein n=1 Tax=Thioalkalivibrio halophilus TaxID=252474 RepID=A0A1V2ZXA3_9GAMM|nr:hypothetical protein [Thioalkalivibrio halophilus]OOC09740.1 hypothetical protein B1A74_08910 [Thioalkalivibrio halophilus]
MDENYDEAARRHWGDARLLDERSRWENADQLYGLAAECALKSALKRAGYFREDQHRKHINVLWRKIQATAFRNQFPGLAGELAGEERFADWDVEQRYVADSAVPEAAVERHCEGARRLLVATGLFRG